MRLYSLISALVTISANYLYFRWLVARAAIFRRPRPRLVLAVVLVTMALAPMLFRIRMIRGGAESAAGLEAIGIFWFLALAMSVPGILLVEAWRRFATKPVSPERRDAITAIAGNAFIGISAIPLGWGMVRTRFDVEVVELPVRIPRLPRALDGLSIVQISDIHVGAYLGDRDLRHAEELIRGLRPDLMVMTGDLVHMRTNYLDLATAWLVRLRALSRFGMASILGNHEYFVGRGAVASAFDRAGVGLLVNESRVVAPGLELAGVDDYYGAISGKGPGPRLDRLRMTPDSAQIVLCHQPQLHPESAAAGFDLQLSGHTHGGQIAPLGPLAVRAIYGHFRGYTKTGNCHVYVNRGLGTSGPPSRVAVRPEITKIVLLSG